MKINIITTGRFHLLDLARELSANGNDVKFYSYVSKNRCIDYGLQSDSIRSYFWFAAPFLFLRKLFPKSELIQKLTISAIDRYVSFIMRDADVCIGLGSIFNHTLKMAKSRGQIYILEWGSMHILDQLKMFNQSHSQWTIDRELWEYENADYIAIAANHVKKTFVDRGIPEEKLLVNPYGVDFSQFYPTECTGEYDVIAVGGWRHEKGSDLIIEMCRNHPELRFLHVGSLVNLEFPTLPNMKHIDAVDQKQLVSYYSKAKVFILPSRAEGLSLVQAQALACGLPVVCSQFTGGSTLGELLLEKKWVIEMKSMDSEELYCCVNEALSLSNSLIGKRDFIKDSICSFTWEAYGKRYNMNINKIYSK